MSEWFQNAAVSNAVHLSFNMLSVRLLIAWLFGCLVAGTYFVTQRKERTEVFAMATTLVLLTILISMVTLVIGDSVARAFSLAGALAIIRFRTIVEDTRDTAFVIFAVVVGMAIGAGYLIVAAVGIPVVAAAAFLLSFCAPTFASVAGQTRLLTVRIGLGRDAKALLKSTFAQYLSQSRLIGVSTARQGSAVELTFSTRLNDAESAISFLTDLNQVEGIISAELSEAP